MTKLQGWTLWRIAREAGVRPSIVQMWLDGRLISPFAQHRIRGTLVRMGFYNTRAGQ